MSDTRYCGTCDGISAVTPVSITNRPGLDTLRYRIGTQSSFFQTMIARLSTLGLDGVSANRRPPGNLLTADGRHSLDGVKAAKLLRDMLSTREMTDPSIALLDAWATLADVLTFYQERLANEGFLRTAQQRRSLVELARLVGYRLRPGVSAAVYLAFEVDDSPRLQPFGQTSTTSIVNPDIVIPASTAAKSSPTPGSSDQPQTFETTGKLIARKEWNAMPVRLTRPTRVDFSSLLDLETLYFDGLGLRLSAGDYLALDVDPELTPVLRSIVSTDQDSDRKVTKVTIEPDSLSTRLLIDDIEILISKFLTEEPPTESTILTKSFQESVRSKFTEVIEVAYGSAAKLKLVGIDDHFHQFLCKEMTESSSGPECIIGQVTRLNQWATFVKEKLAAIKSVVQTERTFILDHERLLDEQVCMIKDGMLFQSMSRLTTAEILLAIKQVALFDRTKDERLVIGHDFQTCSQFPFINLKASVPSWMTGPFTVTVAFVKSKTIFDQVLSDITELANAEIEEITASRYAQITVYPQGTDRLLAVSMMEIYPKEEPKDRIFGRLKLQNVSLWKPIAELRNEQFLDHHFRCFADIKLDPGTFGGRFVVLDRCERNRLKLCSAHSQNFFTLTPEDEFTFKIEFKGSNSSANTKSNFEKFIRQLIIVPVRDRITSDSSLDFERNWIRLDLYYQPEGLDLNQCPSASALYEIVRHDFQTSVIRQLFCDALARVTSRERCENDPRLTRQFATDQTTLIDDRINKIADSIFATDKGLQAVVSKMAGQFMLDGVLAERANLQTSGITDYDDEIKKAMKSFDSQLLKRIKKEINTEFANRWTRELRALAAPLIKGVSPTVGCITERLIRDIGAKVVGPILILMSIKDLPGRVNQAVKELVDSFQPFAEEAQSLYQELEKLAADIAQALSKRQRELRSRFAKVQAEFEEPFKAATAGSVEASVKNRLLDVFVEWNAKIARADLKLYCSDCIVLANQIEAILFEIGSGKTPNSSPTSLIGLVRQLTGESERQLRAIFRRWIALNEQVKETADGKLARQPGLDLASAGDLTQQVDSILAGTTSAGATDVLLNLFSKNSDLITQVASGLNPERRESLYSLIRSLRVPATPRLTATGQSIVIEPKVYVFRSVAKVFGWNAAKVVRDPTIVPAKPVDPFVPDTVLDKERCDAIFLDGKFDKCFEDQPVAIRTFDPDLTESTSDDTSSTPTRCHRIARVSKRPRTAYGQSSETTQLFFNEQWWTTPNDPPPDTSHTNCYTNPLLQIIRSTRVYCDAEQLILAEEPVSQQYPDPEQQIELVLDQAVFGLSTNKPIILAGKQVFPFAETSTAQATYQGVFLIKQIEQRINKALFGDRYCTCLTISKPLPFKFDRKSLRIFANVAEATHGESQTEVVGNGSGIAFQQFAVKRPEISQVSWPTPTGVKSTLAVSVNDTAWTEVEGLRDTKGNSEQYVTRVDDSQLATLVFGDGTQGARVPTGIQNVRAAYRTGLGAKGNVDAGRITQLSGAPLGVKSVSNPLPANGGADRESIADARNHTPLAVLGMDRLVSVRDYADFANGYAGIGKASSTLLQGIVYVTVSGFNSDPFGDDNQLLVNLKRAYELYGDPSQQFSVLEREVSLLVIQAKIKIDPSLEWEIVEPKVRSALLDRFQYGTAQLAQDIPQSDAIATMQSVEGVVYIDIEKFDVVRQQDVANIKNLLNRLQIRPRISVKPTRVTSAEQELDSLDLNDDGLPVLSLLAIRPAQLCYLDPKIRDTLVLEQIR